MTDPIDLDRLSRILTEAGTQALGFFDTLADRAIEAKAPGDLVSDADRAVGVRHEVAGRLGLDGTVGESVEEAQRLCARFRQDSGQAVKVDRVGHGRILWLAVAG